MLRTILIIILFSSPSVVSLCDKVHAEGILGKFVEALEKATSSNSPKSSKSKKNKKVKSVPKDSPKKDIASPGDALAVGGLGGYDVLKFGMGVDEINKKTACNLEAVPESEGIIPGIDVFVCREFSFDNQPAEARFAFVGGALQGLRISIPFDKKKLRSLPEKYALKYGVPILSPTKPDLDVWERGDIGAEIDFKYSNGTIIAFSINGESGKRDAICIIYSSEKLIQLIDAEDAREAKEDAAIKLSADFDVDPISGACPLEVHFKDKSVGRVRERCWDFGNGEKSTEQNPTHIYNSSGTYTVKLTVSNKVATDEAKKIVQVLPEKLVADAGKDVFGKRIDNIISKESGKYESSEKCKELLDKGTITNVDFIVLDALLSARAEIKNETGEDPGDLPSREVLLRAGVKIASIHYKYLDLSIKSEKDSNEYQTNVEVLKAVSASGLSIFYMAKKNGIDLSEEYRNGSSEFVFYMFIAQTVKQIPK